MKEAFHAQPPVPADDGRRNLVAQGKHQDGRVVGECPDARQQFGLDLSRDLSIVEERNVLRPGQTHHDAQSVASGYIEQVAPWRRIHPHGVDAERGHQTEVFVDLHDRGKLITLGVWCEGPVGDALDEKAIGTETQELAVDFDADIMRNRSSCSIARGRIGLEGNAHGSWGCPPLRQRTILVLNDMGDEPGAGRFTRSRARSGPSCAAVAPSGVRRPSIRVSRRCEASRCRPPCRQLSRRRVRARCRFQLAS